MFRSHPATAYNMGFVASFHFAQSACGGFAKPGKVRRNWLATNSEFSDNIMNQFLEYEWHEFASDQASEMLPGPHKKLKIYADANIPAAVIDELRTAGVPIASAVEIGRSTHPDENIYQQAKRRCKVLLTMDRDFWDDRKYPLQKGPGIIFVGIPPDQLGKAIDGLARFYALFAKYYPLDWWESTKARITEYGFVIKCYTWQGRISEDEFRLADDGKLPTRRLRQGFRCFHREDQQHGLTRHKGLTPKLLCKFVCADDIKRKHVYPL